MSTNSETTNLNEEGENSSPTAAEIQTYLIENIAEMLQIEPDELDVTIPFERYGRDSEDAVVLSGDLQEWLDFDLDPTILFDYPTIEALVGYLKQEKLEKL